MGMRNPQEESWDESEENEQERVTSDALVNMEPPATLVAINRILSGRYRGEVFSSLPNKTREDKLALYRACAATGNDIEQMKQEPFNVVHVVISHAEFPDDTTGEVKTGAKLVLIDQIGNPCVVLSQTFIKAFTDIISMFAPLPFDPPLRIMAKEIPLKGGRRYYLPNPVQ